MWGAAIRLGVPPIQIVAPQGWTTTTLEGAWARRSAPNTLA
jgi:hypothetical protein